MKLIKKYLFHRLTLTGLAILLQLALIILILLKLTNHFIYVYIIFMIISIIIALFIIDRNDNPSFKLLWIALIFIFPLLGGILYIFIGHPYVSKKNKIKWQNINKQLQKYRANDNQAEFSNINQHHLGQIKYLCNYANTKLYKNTKTNYYSLGDYAYPEMIEDLKKAKNFIFIEYFIIEEGRFWNDIVKILKEKAEEGVEVRVMYDDLGCIALLPSNYQKTLASYKIKAIPFNRFIPILSLFHNNRDHRKIMIIDGKVGYTGGINLADEYVNLKEKYGHWKDTVIRLEGPGVEHLTTLFLELWNYATNDTRNIEKFFPKTDLFMTAGYVIPFGDNPFDKEQTGKEIYMSIIEQSTNYVYINTPYFIVDYDVITALIRAAKRGVDIKITLPHIPDKKYVKLIAESYYKTLIKSGVKIYEYKPGFIHAKSLISDDTVAVVGTINLDYRSLVHHFEDGIYLYNTESIKDIKKDYLNTLQNCLAINENNVKKISIFKRIIQSILKLFSPLL